MAVLFLYDMIYDIHCFWLVSSLSQTITWFCELTRYELQHSLSRANLSGCYYKYIFCVMNNIYFVNIF